MNVSKWLIPGLLCLLGCGRTDEIRQYRVAKEDPAATASTQEVAAQTDARATVAETIVPDGPPTDRMLAALVQTPDRVWSFKLLGTVDTVAPYTDGFRTWIKGIKFVADPDNPQATVPKWMLPEGWAEQPGSQMRFATVLPDPSQNPSLTISVVGLPSPQDPLANVNRWRAQVMLNPITTEQMRQTTETVSMGTASGLIVDLLGHLDPKGVMGPAGMVAPFAKGRDLAPITKLPQPSTPTPTEETSASADVPLTVHPPESWNPMPLAMSQTHHWELSAGEQKGECTISRLGAAGGDVLANVNRWRGQIKLAPSTQADLDKELKQLTVGGIDATYVQLTNPESAPGGETIAGAIVPHADKVWFFKLRGPTSLVESMRESFESMCSQVKFAQ